MLTALALGRVRVGRSADVCHVKGTLTFSNFYASMFKTSQILLR